MDFRDLQAGQTNENFWFKAKNELIDVLLQKVCRGKKELMILNVGAGTGDDLKILNKYGKNYVIDIDDRALSLIDSGLCVEKKAADACRLPYGDNFFDIVVSFDVFEHIKNDKKAAGEIYRVLKNGGVLIFTVPAFQFLFSSHDKALGHQRRYDKKSIRALLARFDSKIFFWNSLLFAPLAVVRLLRKRANPEVDRINLPPRLNAALFYLLKIDNFLIKSGLSPPLGLSLVGFAFKPEKK